MKKLFIAAIFFLAFLSANQEVKAQQIGPHLGYHLDAENLLVGIQARLNTLRDRFNVPLTFNPSAQAMIIDNATSLQFDLNALFHIGNGTIQPHVGGGLAVMYFSGGEGSSNTDLGINAVGGIDYDMGTNMTPFAQVRVTFSDGGHGTSVLVGVNFGR